MQNIVRFKGGTLRWPGYLEAALEVAEKKSLRQCWDSCKIINSTHGTLLALRGAMKASRFAIKNVK